MLRGYAFKDLTTEHTEYMEKEKNVTCPGANPEIIVADGFRSQPTII